MKNILFYFLSFVFIVSIFSSCAVYPHIKHHEYTYLIDLTKYSDKNFLFTYESYSGKYESCGFVEGELYPEVKYLYDFEKETYDVSKFIKIDNWIIERISVDQLIEEIYNKVKTSEANAIVNFKIVKKRNPRFENYPTDGYFISGFAIRRIE